MAASARNTIACFALLVSILALQVPSCVDQRGSSSTSGGGGTTTKAAVTASACASASAPPPGLFDDGALKTTAMLALAGVDAIFIAAAFIHRHHTHHAAGAGGGNWRVSELVFFVLCLQVGVLQFLLFVKEPAAAAAAAARALGTSAAHHALPCVASGTFFLGITLIYAHVGIYGGAAVVAGNGPVPAPATIKLLARMTLGAALVCLMSIIVAVFYINNSK